LAGRWRHRGDRCSFSSMRIGIIGTGIVGKTLGTKLAKLGHDVRMGSRAAGGEKAKVWVKETGSKSSEGTFADAAAHGEIVFNCTSRAWRRSRP
jgi:predicted dinucleotide-binding enzyme